MSEEQPSYREMAEVIENLGRLAWRTRVRRSLTLREAAKQIGTDGATILRLESGQGVNKVLIPKVLRWMDERK